MSKPTSTTSASGPAPGAAPRPILDRWAMVLSGICVVHCLAIPAVALLLPALVQGSLAQGAQAHQTLVHWILLGLALPLSGLALWTGYRNHGRSRVLVLGAAGLSIMFLGVSHLLGMQAELVLSTSGALVLLVAHIINIRLTH